MTVMEELGRKPRWFIVALGLLLVLELGFLDYVTGSQITFSVFYLVPVSLVAWFAGRLYGFLASFACALAWLIADILTVPPRLQPFVPMWNAAVGLDLFLIVSYLLSALRQSRARQEQLSQFIVHDLRSPLTNIMTGLETLEQLAGARLDEMDREVVGIAKSSGNRMLMLINALLDLSRLEAGKMPVALTDVRVADLVDSSLEQVALSAAHHGITLQRNLASEEAAVRADRELTARVLINLLSNAVRYSPRESVVTLRVAAQDPKTLVFSVSDQGPGIPPEWTQKVFDKFAQVEARKAGVAVGSGLGLSFCRIAVEAQGGRIWLESEVGKGTTVFFTLPAAQEPATAGQAAVAG